MTNPILNPNEPTFTIVLANEKVNVPKIYTKKEIECARDPTTPINVICSFTGSMEEDSNSYDIYYEGECGSVKYSGITVKFSYTEVNIVNITSGEGTECLTGRMKKIILTADKEPTGANVVATLTDGKDNYIFDICTSSGTIITCTTSSPISIPGVYRLGSIKGDDIYNKDQVESMEIEVKAKEQILGDQLNTEPVIDNETSNFTIILASSETEAPGIYIDEENEIKCEKNEERLICVPTDSNMPENKEYDILYRDVCGKLVSTGITVTKMIQEVVVADGSNNLLWNKITTVGLIIILLL